MALAALDLEHALPRGPPPPSIATQKFPEERQSDGTDQHESEIAQPAPGPPIPPARTLGPIQSDVPPGFAHARCKLELPFQVVVQNPVLPENIDGVGVEAQPGPG